MSLIRKNSQANKTNTRALTKPAHESFGEGLSKEITSMYIPGFKTVTKVTLLVVLSSGIGALAIDLYDKGIISLVGKLLG